MDEKEKQAVANARRPGWIITGRRQETQSVQRLQSGVAVTVQEPTGNLVWTISSPDGKQTDEITVTPPPAVGAGTTDEDAAYANARTYTVVKGPSHEVPADTTSRTTPTPASGLEIIRDPTSGKPIKYRDPATGTVIDLPDAPAGSKPSIVQGPKDSVYAWDGQSLTPLIAPSPDKPDKPQVIQGQRGALYSWDGQNLNTIKAGDPAPAPDRAVAVVDNQLIDKNTGAVIYTAPQGVKFQTSQDGTILAIDPANPSNVHVIWSPVKPPELVPGQRPDQPNLLQRDPATGALTAVPNPLGDQRQPTEVSGQQGPNILQKMPDGSFQSVPNPAYVSAQQQALQEYLDGINQIEGMIASGQFGKGPDSIAAANRYKDALRQQYDAKLKGTTPYQIEQDRQRRESERAQLGRDVLNQRVSSGTNLANALLGQAVGIVSNKNFMDPSAIAGLNIFGGAASVPDFINQLGGGAGVYNNAAGAVQSGLAPQSDAANALLMSALSAPGPAPQPVAPQPTMPPPMTQPTVPLLPPGQTGTAQDPTISPYPPQDDPAAFFLKQALGGQM